MDRRNRSAEQLAVVLDTHSRVLLDAYSGGRVPRREEE